MSGRTPRIATLIDRLRVLIVGCHSLIFRQRRRELLRLI